MRSPYIITLVLGAAVLLPAQAQQQTQEQSQQQTSEETGLRLLVGLGLQDVDNIYAATSNPVADLITTTSLGLTLNAGYSRQSLRLNARLDDNRYQSNSRMSYQGSNASALWQWESGAGWFGSARIGRVVTQNVATINVDATQRNLNTTRDNQVMAGYNFSGGWQAVTGVVNINVTNERAVLGQSNYRYNGAYVGVTYALQSGSTVGVQTLVANGFNLYDFRLVSSQIRFETKSDGATAESGSGALSGSATLSYTRQTYETRPEYDFAGQAGIGSLRWQLTDKTAITTAFQRQLIAVPFANSVYTVNDTVMLVPSWQITSKVVLKGDLQKTEIRFKGDPGGGASGEVIYFKTHGVNLEWVPRERSTVGLSFSRSSRTRNLDDSNARVQRIALTGTIQF